MFHTPKSNSKTTQMVRILPETNQISKIFGSENSFIRWSASYKLVSTKPFCTALSLLP